LILCVALTAVLFPQSPASSVEAQPSPAPAITPPTPAKPKELSAAEETKLEQKCETKDLEFVPESATCSHGGDPPPPGKNIYVDVKPVVVASPPRAGTASSGGTAQAGSFACDGDGVAGPRTQVVYVRASDVPDRFATFKSSILFWANAADQVYRSSAAETGGSRRIRFVHDSTCAPVVLNVTIPAAADDEFNDTIGAMEDQGFNRTDRNYMMFVDANVYCGVSTVELDDRPDQDNANNIGPSYARTDGGCWGGEVVAHEHMHNMGGVQMSAPHASGGMHCTDEHDVMCYSDEPDFPIMQMLCQDPMRETDRFDCNYDDYFNANPAPGSYLATRWNTASNKFLVGGGAKPCPDQATEPNNDAGSARPIPVGGTQSYAFCAAGDSDWVRFDGSAGKTYRVSVGNVAPGTDPVVQVYGNNGRIVLRADDPPGTSTSLRADLTVRTTGTFHARVSDNFWTLPSPDKTYTISVGQVSGSTHVGGWGYNGVGALGLNPTVFAFLTSPLGAAPELSSTQVSAGLLHSLAVGSDGSAWAFGWNAYGELGDGTKVDRHSPIKIGGLNDVVGVSAGGLHSLAVKSDGTVWSWGWNWFGQLGDGTTQDRLTPVQVQGLNDVIEVAAGTWHSLALKRDGSVWAWGWNVFGELGDGTVETRLAPVKLPIDGVASIAGGWYHSVAAKADGTVWGWGYNGTGQLGDGTRSDRSSPVRTVGISDVYRVSAGLAHSLAVRNDGSVWGWGYNAFKQAGGADPADRLTPGPVLCSDDPACPRGQGLQLGKIAWVSGGGFHSTALSVDGKAWSWGLNNIGQLGDGGATDSARAVATRGGSILADVSAGFIHSLGG
jgi:alpha-tubulin suppressor-like RCC1 family protein